MWGMMPVSKIVVSMHNEPGVTGTCCPDRWHRRTTHKAMRAARLSAGPEMCVSSIMEGFSTDFVAPEMVTASQLFDECAELEDLEGHMRNVIAADAWAVGATLYHAATGCTLVESDPDDTSITLEDFTAARQLYLQEVHVGWEVSQTCQPVIELHGYDVGWFCSSLSMISPGVVLLMHVVCIVGKLGYAIQWNMTSAPAS